MAGQTITIKESDITGQSATSKAVVISRSGEPDTEIPFEAGQSLNIIESGANFQLTMTDGDSQWIIESTDLVAIEARRASLEALIPAIGGGGGASESTAQEIADNTIRGIAQTETTFDLTTTVQEISPANPTRQSLKIFNCKGSPRVRFRLDNSDLSVANNCHIVPPGGANGSWYEFPIPVPTGSVWARTDGATGTSHIIVTEG